MIKEYQWQFVIDCRKWYKRYNKGPLICSTTNITEADQPLRDLLATLRELAQNILAAHPVARGRLELRVAFLLGGYFTFFRISPGGFEGVEAVVVVVNHLPLVQRQHPFFPRFVEEVAV